MLVEETGDEELGDMWRTATAMHVNFHENRAPRRGVERSLKRVEALLEKLKRLRKTKNTKQPGRHEGGKPLSQHNTEESKRTSIGLGRGSARTTML